MFSHLVNTALIGCLLVATMAQAGSSPEFALDPPAKRALVKKALDLRIGDSAASVLETLGNPTFDQPLVRKEHAEQIGRSMKYYVVIWRRGVVNELQDQLIDLSFDPSDHLRRVDIRVSLE